MRSTLAALALILALTAAAEAAVLNVEFKFTPFVGDPAKSDAVTTVAGTARVYLNGVPYTEQEVSSSEVPVMFDEREIAASVWLPAASCGPALRKGANTVRIEFVPREAEQNFRAQLRWASVTDETSSSEEDGKVTTTNQSSEGVEEKEGKGTLVLEKSFQADFAADLPWHHYPAVSELSAKDRQALADLVARRRDAFQPDFSGLYRLLEGREGIDLQAIRTAKCLDQAYAVGARIASPPSEGLDFITTGNPEVVVRAKEGQLFFPSDLSVFEKITDQDVQMCAGMALAMLYPPRLVVVRSPAGDWDVVY